MGRNFEPFLVLRSLALTAIVCTALMQIWASEIRAQQAQADPVQLLTPSPGVPLFFREDWRQTGPFNAGSGFRPQHPITAAAVSNPNLELRVYDPAAGRIAEFAKNPPPNSSTADWRGPTCVLMSGYSQNPRPERVPAGEPTDPPNLWTGACTTPVAVTLRDKDRYVDLTGRAKIRWVTRVSGFHVVRPVVKLADGTWLVGDYAEGAASSNSTLFLETEFSIAPIRWLTLDIGRVVTRGVQVDKPDLSKVDEVGFADLMPGSGHGWGGFVNVGAIEVSGRPVKR
jgi:hypothetical protein